MPDFVYIPVSYPSTVWDWNLPGRVLVFKSRKQAFMDVLVRKATGYPLIDGLLDLVF